MTCGDVPVMVHSPRPTPKAATKYIIFPLSMKLTPACPTLSGTADVEYNCKAVALIMPFLVFLVNCSVQAYTKAFSAKYHF